MIVYLAFALGFFAALAIATGVFSWYVTQLAAHYNERIEAQRRVGFKIHGGSADEIKARIQRMNREGLL